MNAKTLLTAVLTASTLAVALPAAADDDRRDDRWERRDDRRDDRWDRRDERRDDRWDRRGDRWERYDDRWERRDDRYRSTYRWDDRAGYRGRAADRLDWRIDQGVRRGQLTRAEAARLYAELNWLSAAERRAARDGLSWRERQELDRRYDRLAWEVRRERRDDDRRHGYYPRR